MAAQFYIPTRDAQEFQFLSLTVVFDNKRPNGCEVVPSLPFKHVSIAHSTPRAILRGLCA